MAKPAAHRLQARGTTRRQQQRARAQECWGHRVEQRCDLQRQIDACRQRITVLGQALAGLGVGDQLYEIDSAKAQLMTHLQGALANSAL